MSNQPTAIVLPASVVSLVEQEAHRLLCAQEAVTKAILSEDFGALRQASRALSITSTEVYGALSVALRDQAGAAAGAQAVRPEVLS